MWRGSRMSPKNSGGENCPIKKQKGRKKKKRKMWNGNNKTQEKFKQEKST